MINEPLPPYVRRYFWGDNLSQLDLVKNQKYIVEVLLEKGSRDALKWLLTNIDKKELKRILPTLKLSSKSANFWQIYLS